MAATQAQAHDHRPVALRDQRVVQELETGEVMVYDLQDDRVHCLDPTSAGVWSLCDGKRTIDDIARELALPVDEGMARQLVGVALDELHGAGLVDAREAPETGVNRRELMLRVSATAAAAFVVPTVLSILAPTPAAASTCIQSGGACTSNLQCCSGFCKPGGTCA